MSIAVGLEIIADTVTGCGATKTAESPACAVVPFARPYLTSNIFGADWSTWPGCTGCMFTKLIVSWQPVTIMVWPTEFTSLPAACMATTSNDCSLGSIGAS